MSPQKCHVPFLRPASPSFSGSHITFCPVGSGWNPPTPTHGQSVLPTVALAPSSLSCQSPATSHQLDCLGLYHCALHIPAIPYSPHGSHNAPFKISSVPPSTALVPITFGQEPSQTMVVLQAPTTYLTSLPSFLISWPPLHSWNMPADASLGSSHVLPLMWMWRSLHSSLHLGLCSKHLSQLFVALH